MKIKALIEVLVVFGLTLLLITIVSVSPIGKRERQVSNRFFIEYGLMIAIPLLFLIGTRRNLSTYGLSFKNIKYHLDVAATGLIPVSLASVPLAFLNAKQWDGGLILAGVQIALLFVLGVLLKSKPTQNENGVLIGLMVLLINWGGIQKVTPGNAISALIFYILFLGLGEELLFRGYIQSRLNNVFGRPFQFYGVNWGWGILITAGLFGFMHVLNLGSLVTGSWAPAWWWGFWTLFTGLVLGLVREKTGSIAAPWLLHGLPQAMAYAFLGL